MSLESLFRAMRRRKYQWEGPKEKLAPPPTFSQLPPAPQCNEGCSNCGIGNHHFTCDGPCECAWPKGWSMPARGPRLR